MLTRLRRSLAPPLFPGDEQKERLARLLHVLALAAIVLLLLAAVLNVPQRLGSPDLVPNVVRIVVTVVFMIWTLVLVRQGRIEAGSWLFCIAIWLSTLLTSYTTGGIRSYEFPTFITIVTAGGLLLGFRPALGMIVLTLLAAGGMVVMESQGLLPPFDPASYTTVQILTSRALDMLAVAMLVHFVSRDVFRALDRARRYAASLEESQKQLEAQRQSLEEIVESRTRALAQRARYLESTSEIARETAAVFDLDMLVSRAVTLISQKFGFYQVAVFLVDASGEWVVLKAASDAEGRVVMAPQRRFRVGQEGIVGRVAETGEAYNASDIFEDPLYIDDLGLGQTRAEMALPLVAQGEVIGVLDVQSENRGAFEGEPAAVLQILADQLSVAINNAHLFRYAAERQKLERRSRPDLSVDTWRELLRDQAQLGFARTPQGLVPADERWSAEMDRALDGDRVLVEADGMARLAIPVRVGGRTIAVMDVARHLANQEGDWTDQEISLLESLGEQLGVALDSARLHRDTQRREARERMLGEIAGRVRGTLDVDAVLRTAVREMRVALGIAEVAVWLDVPDAEL